MIELSLWAAYGVIVAAYLITISVVVLTRRQIQRMKVRPIFELFDQDAKRAVARDLQGLTATEQEIKSVQAYLRDLETESAALPNDHPEQEALAVLRTAAEGRLEDLQRQVDTERVEALGERWMNMKTYPKGDR